MEKLADHTPYQWVEESLDMKRDFIRAAGNRVGRFIPPVFEAYVKILHPIYLNNSYTGNESWDDLHPKRGLFTCLKGKFGFGDPFEKILDGATLVRVGIGSEDPSEYTRVTWREAAEDLGLTFHPEINERSFIQSLEGSWPAKYFSPEEGWIELELFERLVKILARHTTEKESYFFYEHISCHGLDSDGPVLYLSTFSDLIAWMKKEGDTSPTYFWAQDHTWCANSEIDTTFTILGGSRALIDELPNDDVLDTVEITEQYRLDYLSDVLNVPGSRRERERKDPPPVVPDSRDKEATISAKAALKVFQDAGFHVKIEELSAESTFISNAFNDITDNEAVISCGVFKTTHLAKKRKKRGDTRIGNTVCSLFFTLGSSAEEDHWKKRFDKALAQLRKL